MSSMFLFVYRHELENMREKSSIQLAFSKRQKTDLATLEFELNRSARGLNQGQIEFWSRS